MFGKKKPVVGKTGKSVKAAKPAKPEAETSRLKKASAMVSIMGEKKNAPAVKKTSAPVANGTAIELTEEEEEAAVQVELNKGRRRDRVIMGIAALFVGVVVYFLLFSLNFGLRGPGKQLGRVQTKGTLRIRHAGNWVWKNVSGDFPVYHKDILYIPRETSAIIDYKNKKIEIPPETMIQVDESTLEDFLLSLQNLGGTLMPMAIPNTHLANFLPELAPIDLRWEELRSRSLSKVFETLPLKRSDRMTKNVFNLDRFDDYLLTCVLPEAGRYDLEKVRWMTLAWTPIPLTGVEYEVDISKDPSFLKLLPRKTKINRLLVQFDEEASYYWRVKAKLGENQAVTEDCSFAMSFGSKGRGLAGQKKPGDKK